jgi:hypothetical protein
MMDLVETTRPMMQWPYRRPFRAIQTGDFVTDIAWIAGLSHQGLVISDFVRVPVVHLILKDVDDTVIPTATSMMDNVLFHQFARLIKYCFGRHTGVFASVLDTSSHLVVCMELDDLTQK